MAPGYPVRQELIDVVGRVCGQTGKHSLEIGMRVVPVHERRLDRAHDGGSLLLCAHATGKQPLVVADGNGPDLVLAPVVVHRQLRVSHKAGQRFPAPQAVSQCPRRMPIRWAPGTVAASSSPAGRDQLGLLLPKGLALFYAELFDFALDVIDPCELLQGEPAHLALVGRVQDRELAPGVGQTPHLGHAAGD